MYVLRCHARFACFGEVCDVSTETLVGTFFGSGHWWNTRSWSLEDMSSRSRKALNVGQQVFFLTVKDPSSACQRLLLAAAVTCCMLLAIPLRCMLSACLKDWQRRTIIYFRRIAFKCASLKCVSISDPKLLGLNDSFL